MPITSGGRLRRPMSIRVVVVGPGSVEACRPAGFTDRKAGGGGSLSQSGCGFAGMPRISAFYGIAIAMYFDDHPPPHFHAKYGEYQAQVDIATAEVLNGDLPRRALLLVQEWTQLHRDELSEDWARAQRQEPLRRIEPLP